MLRNKKGGSKPSFFYVEYRKVDGEKFSVWEKNGLIFKIILYAILRFDIVKIPDVLFSRGNGIRRCREFK